MNVRTKPLESSYPQSPIPLTEKTTAPLHDLSLQYTQTTFHNLSRSPFAGSPSAQIDASWDELLAPMNIRVTKAELQRENLESIALKDSDGYLSWIGAFHQLHCIVRTQNPDV